MALPAATMPVGLLPSTALMVIVWLYMAVSGLLVAEANVYVRSQKGKEDAGLLATIAYLLGKGGAIASAILYLFIHYALLIAYTARGGDILATAANHLIAQPLPLWCGHILFSALLCALLFFGKESFVGKFNSVLLLGILASFVALVALTLSSIEPASIAIALHKEPYGTIPWAALGTVIPVMFVAFVYHNVVPVVVVRLEGDRAKIRQAILLGSLIPLFLFLIWNAVILLSVGETGSDPIERLQSGINGSQLGAAVSAFSELSVATSFIGFVYGLLSFLGDTLPTTISTGKAARPTKFGLVFIPPLLLSVLSPTIFFDAIEVAGAFGVSVLFGVLPALMVWKARYGKVTGEDVTRKEGETASASESFVFGEKALLVVMVSGAIAIIIEHTLQLLAA